MNLPLGRIVHSYQANLGGGLDCRRIAEMKGLFEGRGDRVWRWGRQVDQEQDLRCRLLEVHGGSCVVAKKMLRGWC